MGEDVRTLVTGVAGFIGSNLAAALLDEGHTVVGVDCFTPYYDEAQKRANVVALSHAGLEMVEADLLEVDLKELLAGVEVVFHQAGQPGVRLSWSEGFGVYERQNIAVTQRLLEAAREASLDRFVFASSSSVYGNAPSYPTSEDDLPRPHSPYGVTKLAAEHLCGLYAEVHGLPTVALRYFTVYGPGQRPDMLMHRLFDDALANRPVPIFGAGDQVREFTFVADVVGANRLAAIADVPPGSVVNIAGGAETTVRAVIDLVGELVGQPVAIEHQSAKAGDVRRTGGAIERAHALLGWEPHTDLEAGLTAQLAWHRQRPGTPERD
jgi:nucleoside-diphosphate-sugar epimerase